MHHVPLTIDKSTARELWRAYQKHKHWSEPIDHEIMTAYQKLAQGKLVIKALESVVTAGVNAQGLPKLAITRADAKLCKLSMNGTNGSATMSVDVATTNHHYRRSSRAFNNLFHFPSGSFLTAQAWRTAEALVPLVPLIHRPKRALSNYHILWEAEWSRAVPVDPFLLRRIGKADLWLVLAMWDLTEVERAALAARL